VITGDTPIVAGACRFCGCQEDTPCPGGCAWTDESQTLCTHCLTLVEVAITFVDALGVAMSGPRSLMRSQVSAWTALSIAAQRQIVAALHTHLEDTYDEIAQSIMDEAFLDSRAITEFLDARCPEELEKDDTEPLGAIVIRLLEPHVGSRLVLPGGGV
jgi:hypothetical protein